jgi:hypothetical protein
MAATSVGAIGARAHRELLAAEDVAQAEEASRAEHSVDELRAVVGGGDAQAAGQHDPERVQLAAPPVQQLAVLECIDPAQARDAVEVVGRQLAK